MREKRHGIGFGTVAGMGGGLSSWKHSNQTPVGYKFAPLVWLVNKGERTSTSPFALGYPLLGPSRHVRAYQPLHAVVQPWLSLQRSVSSSNAPALVLIVDCRFTHSMPFGVFCHCNYARVVTKRCENGRAIIS